MMMHPLKIALVVALLLLGPAAARAAVTAEQIDTAVNKAKAFLYKQQKPDGTWETVPPPTDPKKLSPAADTHQWGGKTAMAVYALLTCGEPATEPRLQKAIEFLHKSNQVNGTYALSLKCQVWMNLPPTPEVLRSMRRDAGQLLNSAKTPAAGNNFVVWDYFPRPNPKEYSFSRSQYAALGLWAAQEMDVEIRADVWRTIERTWEAAQAADGGWRYMFEKDTGEPYRKMTTMCMTAAGLATMYITQDHTKTDSPAIGKALKWMGANFKERVAVDKKLEREFPYAQLYAIERVGLAGGLRRIGDADWYEVGAAWLLKKQKGSGAIGGTDFGELPDTCWSMLFLQRGRTPAAFNKLDYAAAAADPKKAEWNARPRDIANLTRWLSRSGERELRWQIVGIDDTVNAMLEAPLLYLSGENAIELNEAAKTKLRTFCQSGGMIVANADGANSAFARSVEKLGLELFPGFEWRELPEDHPIWATQNYKRDGFKTKIPLRGLSNGVRELMIVMPSADPGKAWQLRSPKRNEDAWRMGANLLSYAVSISNFYSRGQSWLAPEPPAAAKTSRSVTVGRYEHSGNWNPEPEAWTQMIKIAKAGGVDLKVVPVKAGTAISGVDLLHIGGVGNFKLDEAARKQVKEYSEKGGLVMFEAIGGNREFGAASVGELIALYGNDKLRTLPAKHAIYNGKTPLPSISFRTYNIDSIANPLAPQLNGIEENGKLVALLSKEDLTAGMLGVPHDGIMGYRPPIAREVMLRVISNAKK